LNGKFSRKRTFPSSHSEFLCHISPFLLLRAAIVGMLILVRGPGTSAAPGCLAAMYPTDLKKHAVLLILFCMFAIPAGYTAEVDSVTPRRIQLPDSVTVINDIFNQRILEGIQKANARQGYSSDTEDFPDGWKATFCDEEALYTELRKAIFQSFIVSLGLKGYDLDRQLRELLDGQSYSLALNDSIYRDINYIEGFSLNLKELSVVVKLHEYLVGLDKIGHLFAQGWQYFDMTAFDGATLYEALDWGRQKEAGLYGYTTTGIFSYADLAVNLNGWRFWNKVLLKTDDPLQGIIENFFARPYVSCSVQIIDSFRHRKLIRAWETSSRFDLQKYLDGAWDEGNNCNSYADPTIEEKVTARIEQADPDFVCPLNAADCRDARDKYGDYAKYVLHPFCLTAQ